MCPRPIETEKAYTSRTRQALAFSSHFGTFTPFTVSHRASESSPIKAGTATQRNNAPAIGGERITARLRPANALN